MPRARAPGQRPARSDRRGWSCCAGSGGHLQRDEVARGHRRAAADDDDRAEQVFHLRRGIHIVRCRSPDHSAQEPARAVDADEAREALAGRRVRAGRDGHLREKLGAERPFTLFDAATLLTDLLADLLARLAPQSRRAGRGERLHLQGRLGVVEADRDDALGLLLDLEPQVEAFARQHLDAAEVDVGPHRVGFGFIERA